MVPLFAGERGWSQLYGPLQQQRELQRNVAKKKKRSFV